MTGISRKKMKDISPEKTEHSEKKSESSEKKSGEIKYKYSINLSSSNNTKEEKHDKKEEPLSVNNVSSEKDTIKIATAKIPADQAIQGVNDLSSLQKNNLPTTLKEKAQTALTHFSEHWFTPIAKISLEAGDSLISLILLKNKKDSNDVISKARPPILFGMWVMIITFLIGGVWSGLAPLDSSSHAQGFVVVASKKQVIQHREGGIIEAIYVKEGEHVQAGQPLIKLSDKTTKAHLESSIAQKNAYDKQLALIQSQLKSMTSLYEKGFIQKDKLINLQAQEAQIIGHISEIDARLTTLEESIERITIKAPVAGTVNQLQVHTIGGTVGSGATLMTIMPKEDDLIIEAYLSPQDIELVHIGLPAKVRISAFSYRTVAPLNGIVTFISSDVVEPPQHHSQESIAFQQGLKYKIKISIDKKQLRDASKYKDLELYPGMMADVMIVTGERTLIQYLLDPVTNTFWHAFIEK